MSDNQSSELPEAKVDGVINAVTELVKAVPVYEDAIQPVAKETGKALQTVGRAVNAALLPIRSLVWGIEKIESFVHTKVAKKLEKIPVENIQMPDPAVAGPVLESLRYTGHKESLGELYANLLASSMDSETAKKLTLGLLRLSEIYRRMRPKCFHSCFLMGLRQLSIFAERKKMGIVVLFCMNWFAQ